MFAQKQNLGSVICPRPSVRASPTHTAPLKDSSRPPPINQSDVPLHDVVADPGQHVSTEFETYVVCRLGNDSQIAAAAIRSARPDTTFVIKDLVGGLRAWSRDVDPGFPVY